MNEPDIMKYFPRTDPPDIERVRGLIERQFTQWKEYSLGWWAVVPHGGSDLIGWNGLQFLPETGEVEVGYLLSRQFWGQGFATEGARVSLKYGFEQLKLREIIGLTHPENIASQNVLKKCGMRFSEQKEYFGMQLLRFCLQSPLTS
jgi:ribosomal-protein-alanine N-acetyltransferase